MGKTMKKIVYQIEVKEGDHGKQFLTIVRGKLGETYPIDDEAIQKVQDFIAKYLALSQSESANHKLKEPPKQAANAIGHHG